MKRIIENISPLYFKHEKDFVKRISQLVHGDSTWEPCIQPSGYHWQIDRGNDWWCTIHANGDLEIAYRYDSGGNTKYVDAVVAFLEATCTKGNDYL